MSEPQRPTPLTSSSVPPGLIDSELEEANTTQNTIQNEVVPAAGETMVEIPTVTIRSATFPTVAENTPRPPFLVTYLSPDLPTERTSSSPRSPPPSVVMEELTDDILPLTVPVKVTIITRHGETARETKKEFGVFSWIRKENYERLLPTETIELHKVTYEQGKEGYHRYGSCRISAAPELPAEMPYYVLDDSDVSTLVQKAIPLICGFIHDHPCRKFSLQIYWDCGYARLRPQPSAGVEGNPKFSDMIMTELRKKRQKNFRNQEYISRRDQSVFQNYDVVRDLVFFDNSLTLNPDDKKAFVHQIIERPALKLLLICVFLSYNLAFLRHLLGYHGCGDENFPQQNMECNLDYCHDFVDQILGIKAMFYVRNVNEDFKYHKFEVGEVVPLRATLPNSELRSLGKGTSGKVYEVWIDSAHHYLTGDPFSCFALKVFPAESAKGFEREMKMLQVLADHPNHNIVPHITSWTQSEDNYILYPAARYNLRTFMQDRKPVGFTKHETLWFLRQLQGLALAIDHVHHLKDPRNSGRNTSVDAYWGCHFDIKPENILVFEKVPGYHPRFKIGDFGVGVFNRPENPGVHSRVTKEAKGTLTYIAPDEDRNGEVSRPSDMWALGCVYLELMLWVFSFFESSEGGFSTARFKCTGADPNNKHDKFWDKFPMPLGGFEYRLKSIVEDVMTELRNVWCDNMPAFQGIITAVNKLLEIDAGNRWTAVELKNHITQTVREAEEFLVDFPEFYSSQYEANCEAEFQRQQNAQESELTPESRRLNQFDRAAQALIHTGAVTDIGPDASRDRHTPDTHALLTLNGGLNDAMERELSDMVESSATSPEQP
ncbi:serine/threonine protein kinase [Cladophialophora psammophila CBS 110553]|uniref:Serine/threonine protein kinase n=1 Tax=Cladophialophora psammophila CBS 110553 TaxID=1182543 RepID=W9WLL6_9EURO|nr:serine/threonine protein kinase [Cladophialophora psammophila CBS 110553]EXJ59329.1 serine/threonine protein kinase [Cladophialophora psammophila CBS 110553]